MNNLKQGFWTDGSQAGLQAYKYLVPESTATVISNAIAVTLTLALPRLYIILKWLLLALAKFWRRIHVFDISSTGQRLLRRFLDKMPGMNIHRSVFVDTNETPLELGHGDTPRDRYQDQRLFVGIQETLQSSATSEDAVSRLACRHLAMPRLTVGSDGGRLNSLLQLIENVKEEPRAFASILAFMLLLFAIYIGIQAMAISSSFIIGDSAAVISEGRCAYSVAYWDDDWDLNPSSVRSGFWGDLSELAIEFEQTCYSGRPLVIPCRGVLTPNLPYLSQNGTRCPFPEPTMCKLGEWSAFTLDTGYLNPKMLGINARTNFEFRRLTVCAPINNNDTFLRVSYPSDKQISFGYLYDDRGSRITDRYLSKIETKWVPKWDYYGLQNFGVWTSQSPATQFTYAFSGQLHKRLIPDNATTSLFFIDDKALTFSAKSDDPIFPAQYAQKMPWQIQPRWLNLYSNRTVLGCTDEKLIRDQTKGREWYVINGDLHDKYSSNSWNITSPGLTGNESLPYSNASLTALRLLGLALKFSDTSSSIKFARSQWLDAASKVVQDHLVLPLAPNQWQVESAKLFNISLARMQTELLYMARGEKLDASHRKLEILDGSLVDPCGMLKIYTDDYKNISVIGFVSMLGMALIIWIVTIETGETIVLVWLFHHALKPLALLIWASLYRLKQTITVLGRTSCYWSIFLVTWMKVKWRD